jgi:hypothetical protein
LGDTWRRWIAINKAAIERLERNIEQLPVIRDLEKTDEYLNKYMVFKVQKMIDDTLFSILPNADFQKLINYEKRQFKTFMTNLKTKESKLVKDEYEVPTAKERQNLIKAKGIDRLKTTGNTVAAANSIMGLFISPASTSEQNASALMVVN